MITDEETATSENLVWIDDSQLKGKILHCFDLIFTSKNFKNQIGAKNLLKAIYTHHEKRLLKLIGTQAKLSEIIKTLPK